MSDLDGLLDASAIVDGSEDRLSILKEDNVFLKNGYVSRAQIETVKAVVKNIESDVDALTIILWFDIYDILTEAELADLLINKWVELTNNIDRNRGTCSMVEESKVILAMGGWYELKNIMTILSAGHKPKATYQRVGNKVISFGFLDWELFNGGAL